MVKIAIIFGTRFGSTEEIALRMKEIAEKRGFEVDFISAKDGKSVEKIFWDLQPFSGILLGSGIQIGKWTKEMAAIMKNHGRALINYKKPLALFASCGMAGESNKVDAACADFVDKIAEEHEITPTMTAAFGGIYDFTKKSRHGKIKSKLLQKIVEKDERENPGTYDLSGFNDMRDWNQVEKFTVEFLAKIS